MGQLNNFFGKTINFTDQTSLSVKSILFIVLALLVTSLLLRIVKKLVTRKLPKEDKVKFNSVFTYLRWFIYVIIFLISLHTAGINVTAIFAASAALLIGIGFALQTLFQDIISGIFILIDQSVHVGDIIELDGKVGRIEDIKLRTTRAVTIDNKVIVIPNHLYLTNSLYNWTQNGTETRENITVGVAYGSDTELVKEILINAALSNPKVYHHPAPAVLFTDFGDNALLFKLIFTINNSFEASFSKSDIRFEIDKRFRESEIQIPFPQRDIHIINK